MDTIGKRIFKFRKEKGLNQQQLAVIVGVGQTSISNWEKDLTFPERKHIEAMAKYFGVSQQELEYGNEVPIVHEAPAGYEIIPTKEYIEFLKYKAEKAEKEAQSAKNIEAVSDKQ